MESRDHNVPILQEVNLLEMHPCITPLDGSDCTFRDSRAKTNILRCFTLLAHEVPNYTVYQNVHFRYSYQRPCGKSC